jgi:formylglycine-generating enzyme required for sulfatase activity
VVAQLVAENALNLRAWLEGFRPVKERLLPALAAVFRDRERRETERSLATDLLADYAAEKPDLLADLILDADEKQFAVLFSRLQAHGARGLRVPRAELEKRATFDWKDAPLDPAWRAPPPSLVKKIEAGQGLLAQRFALCQTIPLEEFVKVAEGLRPCGYRPVRLRPYAAGKGVQVAAVWSRDGRPWRLAHDLTAAGVRRQDEGQRKAGYRPADVAGYLHQEKERYAALWVKTDPKTDVRLYVGVSASRHGAAWQPLHKAEMQPATLHTFALLDGALRFSSVWRKPAPAGNMRWYENEQQYAEALELDEQVPTDVSLTTSQKPRRDVASEAAAWLAGPPWAALAWRSTQQRRYASTWQASATLACQDSRGLDPAAHLTRCRELAAEGYRPAVLAVTPDGAGGPLVTASLWHRPVVAEETKERLAKRQASAGVVLLRLGRPDLVWPRLKHRISPEGADPRVRSYLIHRLSPRGADPRALWERFEREPDVSIRRALLLCLGEFGEKDFPPSRRAKLQPRLFELYRHDPDPGLHGSVAWLLGKWGQRDELKEIDRELAKRDREWASGRASADRRSAREGRLWHVNGQGQTFVLIPGPVEFWMGSLRTEAGRDGGPEGQVERRHYVRIDRTFAISAHPVTVEQFRRFQRDFEYNKQYSPTAEHPITLVAWYEAAAYCNWLSDKEGIPKDQWCYEKNDKGEYAAGMKVRPNYLSLRGYRLPSEAEWEYACRAGAVTARYFGETEELLGEYAWYMKNSRDAGTLRVGTKKPNDLGMFDLHGNVWNWCHEGIASYGRGLPRKPDLDGEYREQKGYV